MKMFQTIGKVVLTTLVIFSTTMEATNSTTWTGAINSDLNTTGNWLDNALPEATATFDSTYNSVNFNPTANAPFSVDTFYFPNNASDFQFSFTGPGGLTFNGTGITGTNTNTLISGTNSTTMMIPQILYSPCDAVTTSLGAASLSFTNTSSGTISATNPAQINFGDTTQGCTAVVTANDGVTLSVTNNGSIAGTNEAGQIFLKGSSFIAGNSLTVNADNVGGMAAISSQSDTAQLLADGSINGVTFSAGDNVSFNFNNGSSESPGVISSIVRGNHAGQIVFDGVNQTTALTLGDYATLNLTNQTGSSISTITTGDNAGQMVFDGDNGVATFSAGDYTTLNLTNTTGSSITGLGYNAAQLVLDGDSGTASFTVGDHANLTISSGSDCAIFGGDDGNDVGQIVLDGDGNTAAFTSGNYTNLSITNSQSAQIAGYFNAGQLVVDGDGGTATFTIGDNGVIDVTNDGAIIGEGTSSTTLAAQIAFNGSQVSEGGVSLNTGTNVAITATNTTTGTITNTGGETPPAQIYFSSTTINGSPTITAINQHPSLGDIEGIVFDGSSTATNSNIALFNTSLVINVSGPDPFTIASLTGDSTSLVTLNTDFEINMANETNTTFAGVIEDASGNNNLIINGAGVQWLSGNNTFGGSTTVNGGILGLTGSVLHDITVNNDGWLIGSGTANGNVTINDEAQIAPYGVTAILTIGQNYTQTSQGTCFIEVSGNPTLDGTPQCGLLAVGGTANLAGALDIYSATGTYIFGTPYTVLTANAINGTFDQITLYNPYVNFQSIYNPDPSVQILLSTNVIIAAQTLNGEQVATQVDGNTQPTADEQVVMNTLIRLGPNQLSDALTEMSGNVYAYLVQTNQVADARFSRRLFNEVRDWLDPCNCAAPCGKVRTWTTFEGGYGVIGGNSNAKGFHEQNFDFTLGADTKLNEFLVGVAANAEIDNLSFNGNHRNTLYNFQGAIYGSYATPCYYVFSDFIVGGGYSNFKRTITFGDIAEEAESRPEFTHGLLYAEYGYDFHVCDVLVQPFISADCDYTYAQEFSESGADSLNLHVNEHSVWVSNFYLGSHFSSKQGCVQFNADLAYEHRFGSLGTNLHSRFVDFGDIMTITASTYSRNGILGNINAVVNIDDSMDFYVELSGESWGRRSNYAGTVGLDYVW